MESPLAASSTERFATHQYPIEQLPSRNRYNERQSFLDKFDFSNICIPSNFPSSVSSEQGWSMKTPVLDDMTLSLGSPDVEELEVAMQVFQDLGRDLNCLSPSTFPLPSLGPRLRVLSADVHSGRGLAVISGLNPDKYSLKDNVLLYGGMMSYIGDQRGSQSSEYDVLTHVKVANFVADARPSLTYEPLPFHNDPGEILCLYVMEPSKVGGKTLLSSTVHVYNEIARTKPYLIDVLSREDWPHYTARRPISKKSLPLLYSNEAGAPFFAFTRYALTGCKQDPRPDGLPPLTDLQADALDTIEFIARENSFELPRRKGDILVVSNRAYFHARTEYADDESDNDRHIIRMNLNDSEYGHEMPTKLIERLSNFFNYPRHCGKWRVEKDHPQSFVSAKQFERLYVDEATGHSNG